MAATNKTGRGRSSGDGRAPGADGGERKDPRLPGEMLMAHLLALLKDWSGYGYELAQRLEEAGFGAYNSGSLYRTLRQMEGLGLISSFWDTSTAGPARRMYSMTRAGQLFLDSWIAMLDFHRRALDIYLDGNRGEPAATGGEAAPNPGAAAKSAGRSRTRGTTSRTRKKP